MESNYSDSQDTNSSISSGSVIKGILSFKGDTRINGSIEGDLNSDAKLVIGKLSRIRANINARSVVVFGQVIGDISAEDIIEIHPGAKVTGDIKAKRVAMHDGVSFDGQCKMEQPEVVSSNVIQLNDQLVKKPVANKEAGESK